MERSTRGVAGAGIEEGRPARRLASPAGVRPVLSVAADGVLGDPVGELQAIDGLVQVFPPSVVRRSSVGQAGPMAGEFADRHGGGASGLRTVGGVVVALDAASVQTAWLLMRDGAYCSASACSGATTLYSSDDARGTWHPLDLSGLG